MDIRKDGENTHGPIYAVYVNSEHVGTVEKWRGLFFARGSCGTKLSLELHEKRSEAAEEVVRNYREAFEY